MVILIVEDDPGLSRLIGKQVEAAGYETCCLHSGAETIEWLEAQTPYMMLLDYSLPDLKAPELLAGLMAQGLSPPPFIIVTGRGDEQIAVEMMKLGARDYLVKDGYLLDRLPAVLQRAAREIESENEHRRTHALLKFQLQFEKMVAEISAGFIALPAAKLDEGIDRALEATSLLFNADRSFVIIFNEKITHFDVTHEWCREGISATMERNQHFPVAGNPWWVGKLLREPYVFIEDVDKMPPEAHLDQADLKIEEIKSLLAIPMKMDGRVFGAYGYERVREKASLTESHVYLLTVVAELIAGAINRHRAEERIRHMSFHDYLTGLYNRYYLEEALAGLDGAGQMPLSIVMADLNGLKLVNDTYGQKAGDELLKRAAAILKASCRPGDIIARFGGDEFLLCLPRTAEKEALALMDKISSVFLRTGNDEVPISMTFGVAAKASAAEELSAVIRKAEDKMYRNKLTESRSGKSAVLKALLKTLAEKSHETEAHTRNMQEVAASIGQKLGLSASELHRLNLLITLHDIGKINIPEEVLTKPGTLSADEWELMKKHPESGYRIARATDEFAHVAEDILTHHERWDGTGYPQGLKGEEIPLLARITAVADAYEVMCNGRPYKKPMTPEEITAEFKRCAGRQFAPAPVEILLELIS